ncbi:HD domain-containing protein [Nocardia concava]|uniref:HD domain-containing protein n=1 Tax=Nocardia concava TaxID=257281 RepID=UPI00030F22BE|nr:HD domain-containing protein [Nocardia concava]
MDIGGIEGIARSYAEAAHGDQKYGGQPYVVHLTAVRAVLADFGIEGDFGVAAWLHDVLEDTDVTKTELEAAFGETVTELVWAVTGIGENRQERNGEIYRKIGLYPSAVIVKLADRIANVEASAGTRFLPMYQAEYLEFRGRLGGLLPGNETVARMWSRLDAAISLDAPR